MYESNEEYSKFVEFIIGKNEFEENCRAELLADHFKPSFEEIILELTDLKAKYPNSKIFYGVKDTEIFLRKNSSEFCLVILKNDKLLKIIGKDFEEFFRAIQTSIFEGNFSSFNRNELIRITQFCQRAIIDYLYN